MVRKIEFQCKTLTENKKKSTAQGQTLTSILEFIDNDANKELTFRLSVTGHPDEVKSFQNDVSIKDVDEFFEASMRIIPKVRQSKLLEDKKPTVTGDVDDEDKIYIDDENEDLED